MKKRIRKDWQNAAAINAVFAGAAQGRRPQDPRESKAPPQTQPGRPEKLTLADLKAAWLARHPTPRR